MSEAKNIEHFAWEKICAAADLTPLIGVRALLKNEQIALFKVQNEYFAINAIDPFTKAAVLARGIIGDVKGEVVVASPIYKQHFSLISGKCLEDEQVSVKVYPVRENEGHIEVALV